MENNEMPLGLLMALAHNPEAMQKFATFDDNKKRKIIEGTRAVTSKDDMRQYVEKIVSMY